MRFHLTFFLVSAIATPTYADAIDEHVSRILGLSEDQCRSEEQTFRALYEGNLKKARGTISFIAEGTRLLCEATRINSERQRLRSEQERLRETAARLEELWRSANLVSPASYPDFPGRDESQQRLLADALRIDGAIGNLTVVHEALISEARRILVLSSDEFAGLDTAESRDVVASLDGEDEYDILCRILNCADQDRV